MRRGCLVIVAVTAVVLGALVYFRPLAVYSALRDVYLRAIGMHGSYIAVGRHRIHYYSGGEGPPLLVVHGVASRAADGAPLFRALMQRRRVYALDLLGYGDSDKPRDADYSVATQVAVVRGFMDAVGLDQPDVLGVSMGGWVTLKLAADHPQRVRRLVLVSSAGLQYPTTLHERSFSAETLDELRASLALQTDRADWLPEFVLRDFLRSSKAKAWIVRRSMRAMFTGTDLLDRRLARVRMPVLLVWGTADRIVPFAVAQAMQREMPHARLIPLEGCGHLAIIECRERALPAILEFLGKPSEKMDPSPLRGEG